MRDVSGCTAKLRRKRLTGNKDGLRSEVEDLSEHGRETRQAETCRAMESAYD